MVVWGFTADSLHELSPVLLCLAFYFWLICNTCNLCLERCTHLSLNQRPSHFMREHTKSRPSWQWTNSWYDPQSDTHKVFNVKIEISSFCIAYVPRREMSLISEEGGHPSAISLSLSACPSRIAQWCQTLIKYWHLTFRTETCTLFFLSKSKHCPAETLLLQIKTHFGALRHYYTAGGL